MVPLEMVAIWFTDSVILNNLVHNLYSHFYFSIWKLNAAAATETDNSVLQL